MKPLSEQDARNHAEQKRWFAGLILFVLITSAMWCILWFNIQPAKQTDRLTECVNAAVGDLSNIPSEFDSFM
jgi:hypothetical protein